MTEIKITFSENLSEDMLNKALECITETLDDNVTAYALRK